MKQLTVKDMRRAIKYVAQGSECDVDLNITSDEALLKMDFSRDLKMGNIRVNNVLIELMRIHNLVLPQDVFGSMKDNSVASMLDAVNEYLKNKY